MNTDEFIQGIIDESEYEIEHPSWWMSQPEQNLHHYPTPIGYQQINANEMVNEENDLNENQHKQHFYPAPKQISQPLVALDDENNINVAAPLNYELEIIYKKLLLSSIVVFIISLLTLIGGYKKYKLRGLILNILVLIASFFGIFCGFYKEKKALQKLKYLLIYFVICCIFLLILFFIEIIYLILLPINNWNKMNLSVLIGTFIFFFGGIIFWLILVLFYIDLISRACLKRGRIGFIIKQINNSFWFKIFALIVCFRFKFRSVRRGLTKMTGINFVALKPILSMKKIDNNQQLIKCSSHPIKEHEEDKIKAILEEGGNIDIVEYVGGKNRFDCFLCNNNEENEGENTFDCLSITFKTTCVLIIFYMFLPLFMLMFCVLLICIPGSIVLNIMKLICGCDCNLNSIYNILAHFIGFLCWIYLWFWIICRNPTDYGDFNWGTQCNMWNYSMFVFVRSVIKAVFIAPLFN